MTTFYLLSDTHLEFGKPINPNIFPDDPSGVLLLAGDIYNPYKAQSRAAFIDFIKQRSAQYMQVLTVMGNHEHYGGSMDASAVKIREDLTSAGVTDNVFLLDNELHEVGGVLVHGGTMWFNAADTDPYAQVDFMSGMNDSRMIRASSPSDSNPYALNITADRAAAECRMFVGAMYDSCTESVSRRIPLVVMSHHAPSYQSIAPEYVGDRLNKFFASHMEAIVVESSAVVWVHGHVHSPTQYVIGNTTVMCAPHGYPGERIGDNTPTIGRFVVG